MIGIVHLAGAFRNEVGSVLQESCLICQWHEKHGLKNSYVLEQRNVLEVILDLW